MNTILLVFLLLLLHCLFTLTNAGCNSRFFGHKMKSAYVGQNVTLPCTNVIKQINCSSTTWQAEENSVSVEVVLLGNRNLETSEKAKRVSLTSDCSLHISDIRAEDCGCYICQQWVNNKKAATDAVFCLYITKGVTHINNIGTTTGNKNELNDTDGIVNLVIVIPAVLTVIALSVVILIVWLRYRRRPRATTSLVNQNDVSNEHNGEVLIYTEVNYTAVQPKEVYVDTGHQETVYSAIKPQ